MNTGEETPVQNVSSTKPPSTVRALSSIVDLICEHCDHETKGFIEPDIAVLKETLAKIEALVKETEAVSLRNRNSFAQFKEENEGRIENFTQPTFPTPPLRGPPSDALSKTVEKERADGDDSSYSKMKKNQIQKTEESRREGDEHNRKTIKTGESQDFADYPHRRRSRKLSQPFLSPLPDMSISSPEVSNIKLFDIE
jgi:hypothetical protein